MCVHMCTLVSTCVCCKHTVQVLKEVQSVGPVLAPFLKTACMYFILDLPEDSPSVASTVVKCLPVIALMMFVWAQGIQGNPYNTRILLGLGFCCLGDAALNWQQNIIMFFVGMGLFGCGHLTYITAFGFTPFGLKELFMSVLLIVPVQVVLFVHIPSPLLVPVMVYAELLCVVFWRALARFTLRGEIPWRKIYAAVGMFLFNLSDLALAVNKFCWPLPYQNALIMGTYYAAQMCIALSVINSSLSAPDPTSSSSSSYSSVARKCASSNSKSH